MEIKKEITINASPSRVYLAITDPKQLTQWFPDVISMEPRIGGKIFFKVFESNTDNHVNKDQIVEGKIVELEENKKISYTWSHSDVPEIPITKISWSLEEVEKEKTRVTIIHSGILDEISIKPYNEKWDWFAERLSTFTDSKKILNSNKKQIFASISNFFVNDSGDKTRPAKRKVNMTLQTILTCIPLGDVWTFYRIKKLRLYLLIMIPVILGISSMISVTMGGSEYDPHTGLIPCIMQNDYEYCYENGGESGNTCEPVLLLSFYYNACTEPEERRYANSVFHVALLVFTVYLVRRWSINWNEGTLQDIKA